MAAPTRQRSRPTRPPPTATASAARQRSSSSPAARSRVTSSAARSRTAPSTRSSAAPSPTRTSDRLNRLSFLVLAVLAGCAASAPPPAPASAAGASSAPGAAPASEEDAPVPIDARNPTWGSRNAVVTIVEFADFQCPFCRVGEATMARLRAAYGPDTLRIVWKNSPLDFHDQAHPTAEAAAAIFATAGNDAFWKFHDSAFAGQADLGLENPLKWASDAGVTDLAGLRATLTDHKWAAAVDADRTEGEKLGVRGTPTFFVNGVMVVGAQPLEKFQALVDDQVKAARAKLTAGTTPEHLYAALARDNRANAPKDDGEGDEPPEDTKTVFKI